jgi:hypothetical protein
MVKPGRDVKEGRKRATFRMRAGALALVGLTALGVGLSAAPAQAANGTVGVRETVCAEDLYVRTEPLGAWMGTLYKGQTFTVEKLQGSWVYGFAYGDINRHGWVQDGWFC